MGISKNRSVRRKYGGTKNNCSILHISRVVALCILVYSCSTPWKL